LTHPYPLVPLEAIKAPGRYALVGGPFGSKLVSRDYQPAGVPVIRGGNLASDGRFSCEDFVFVSEEKVTADLFGNLAFPGDVVVTQRGTLGQVGLIPDSSPYDKFVVSQSQMKLAVDPSKAVPLFVYYGLRSSFGQHEIRSRAITAGVPHINLSLFQEVRLPLPPLPTQRKIAAILSAHDDLIENNNRRIELLDEMAQRIYREWFVDFRYPGHEDVPLVESELGPVPENWSIDKVADHVEVIRGRSYRSVDMADAGGVPFFNLKCVARDGGFRPEGIKRYVGEFKEAQKASTDDIIVAVTDMTQERRIVARAARVPDVGEEFGVFSMDLVKVVPKDLPGDYVLGLLRYSEFPDRVKAHANGANVLHLHPDRIREYRFAAPALAVARQYADQVGPMEHLSDRLEAASERSRATRDLLLARLVSGAIDVSGLDIAVPELAA
jgi:type I restriction enzyme S subunit